MTSMSVCTDAKNVVGLNAVECRRKFFCSITAQRERSVSLSLKKITTI